MHDPNVLHVKTIGDLENFEKMIFCKISGLFDS